MHQITNFLVSYFHKLFYKNVVLVNIENLPKNGPVIIFSNHPNNISDGAVMYNDNIDR